jgi:hypothetical protein
MGPQFNGNYKYWSKIYFSRIIDLNENDVYLLNLVKR